MSLKLRYHDGFWPNVLALGYVVAAYVGGFALLFTGSWLAFVPGVLLLGHAMAIAAYLIHECTHNTVFAEQSANARLGGFLAWLTGACYGAYADVRLKHVRHHVDRADVVSFDYRKFLREHPGLRRLAEVLEWLYIPAVDILMHAFVVGAPFTNPWYRKRRGLVVASLVIRGSLLAALLWWMPMAFLGYLLAYMMFITVMRLMDMHQHTFDVFVSQEADTKPPVRPSHDFEQRNTFSNILGHGRFVNLLVLNFGYHNAHHDKPNTPWYRLPSLHRELYGEDDSQCLPFRNVLRSYHRYRVKRVMSEETGDVPIGTGADKGMEFVGVYGVSFLTAL
ncbi:fatty acid desaturase family protein [Mangrovitalea sediminis]|uniref:fatty acid desaturase family protein n=1 Tax=Mangrovitalea sediminis TaxID=1982043 RepID=UPI000BE606F8|nr:fatty acid desaturase [Mangrovitalea sediminis]